MERPIYSITVDMIDTGALKSSLRIKQNDSGILLKIYVKNNGNTLYDADAIPNVYFRRPDNKTVFGAAQPGDDSQSYLYSFVGSELEVAGTVIADVKFTLANGRESSASFKFECVPDTLGGSTGAAGVIWNDITQTLNDLNAGIKESAQCIADMETKKNEVLDATKDAGSDIEA